MIDEKKLRDCIKAKCRLELEESEIDLILDDEKCDLRLELGLDSLSIVQLLIDIEKEFSIDLNIEEINIRNLRQYSLFKRTVNI